MGGGVRGGRGELKEAMLWSPALVTAARRATILPGDDTLEAAVGSGPASPQEVLVAAPGRFLLDSNPAVTLAGLVAELAGQVSAWQIDPLIAFLSCDEPVTTPFARTMRVLESALARPLIPFGRAPLTIAGIA